MTGVQTCALPISAPRPNCRQPPANTLILWPTRWTSPSASFPWGRGENRRSFDLRGFRKPRRSPSSCYLRELAVCRNLPSRRLRVSFSSAEKAVKHYRCLSWWHTDMIPYWNSLAHEAAGTGAPISRHMVWEFHHDQECWRIDDQFTVGPFLLVAPILNTDVQREVYLPAGRWYDFWDDSTQHEGPKTFRWFKGWRDSLWRFPLLVRAGAIIPLEIESDVSGLAWPEAKGLLTLALWPKQNGESSFVLHDTTGQAQLTSVSADGRLVKFHWKAIELNDLLLRIHAETNPTQIITHNGKPLKGTVTLRDFKSSMHSGWCFDQEEKKLWVRITAPPKVGNIAISTR